MKINIKGLNKAEVLLTLYNHASYEGPFFANDVVNKLLFALTRPANVLEAEKMMISRQELNNFYFNEIDLGAGYRALKVDLSNSEFDVTDYNEMHGKECAEHAIEVLKLNRISKLIHLCKLILFEIGILFEMDKLDDYQLSDSTISELSSAANHHVAGESDTEFAEFDYSSSSDSEIGFDIFSRVGIDDVISDQDVVMDADGQRPEQNEEISTLEPTENQDELDNLNSTHVTRFPGFFFNGKSYSEKLANQHDEQDRSSDEAVNDAEQNFNMRMVN